MKSSLAVLLVTVAVLSAGAAVGIFDSKSKASSINQSVRKEFARWQSEHNRLYFSPAEQDHRLSVFAYQLSAVQKYNEEYAAHADKSGQTLSGPMFSLNEWSDLSDEEFQVRYTNKKHPEEPALAPNDVPEATQSSSVVAAPASASSTDAKGKLGQTFIINVRHQGSCGSCWAYAYVAALEKWYYDSTKTLLNFSQQYLVDCDTRNNGCLGGVQEYAAEFAVKVGMNRDWDYPYIAKQSPCKPMTASMVKITHKVPPIRDFDIGILNGWTARNFFVMTGLVATGKFRSLSSSDDVYDATSSGECSYLQDHSVVVWKSTGNEVTVLNSWGTGWGNRGMKRIKVCSRNSLWGTKNRIAQLYE